MFKGSQKSWGMYSIADMKRILRAGMVVETTKWRRWSLWERLQREKEMRNTGS